MKNLIIINGLKGMDMKKARDKLQSSLDRCVYLDFGLYTDDLTDEIKGMQMDNAGYALNNFLSCPEFENIIFYWTIQEKAMLEGIVRGLDTAELTIYSFSVAYAD